jgi:hypothetical protein
MTDTTPPEGTSPDAPAPDASPEETPGGQADTAAGETGSESPDRPGDIPFDQAAAEHENPALE